LTRRGSALDCAQVKSEEDVKKILGLEVKA